MANWGGLNPALTSWRNGINARLPNRDTKTDGGVADKLHGSNSQHQRDGDGTVDAFDMDVNVLRASVASGSSAEHRLLEALKLDFEADKRSRLWIHNREIASDSIGPWRERYYGGESPHKEHIHWESQQAYERDGSPWKMTNFDKALKEIEMAMTDADKKWLLAEMDKRADQTEANLKAALIPATIAITADTAAEIGKKAGDKVSITTLLQLAVIHAARASKKATELLGKTK